MKNIIAAVRDIMFKARIADTAKEKGAIVSFVNHVDHVLTAKPDVLIIDLNFVDFQPVESIRRIRQEFPGTLKIICFVSHVEHELARRAKEAGADMVMPRSRFVVQLPELL